MISFLDLLATQGYAPERKRVKLVRHKDARYDIEAIVRGGTLEEYQSFQTKPIFDGCSDIIAFVGEAGRSARFVGVYSVGKRSSAAGVALSRAARASEWGRDIHAQKVHYQLSKRRGLEDLEDRVIIDWGASALAWHQWATDREIVEVRERGRRLPPFRDYLRVRLTFDELRHLAAHPGAHRDWVAGLSAVGAIYLIVSSQTGQQYVGSATGLKGLWQRWGDYAKTGHGNNLRLRDLCKTDGHPECLEFSILETFSRSVAKEEAMRLEAFFKQKLGSRAFGLNSN